MLAVAVAGLDGINTSPKTSQCPNSLPGPTAAKHCAGPQHVTNKGPADLGKGPPKGCGFTYLTLLLGFPGCPRCGNTHSSRLFWDNNCRWLCCAALGHLHGFAVSTEGQFMYGQGVSGSHPFLLLPACWCLWSILYLGAAYQQQQAEKPHCRIASMVNNNLGGNFWCQRQGCATLGQAALCLVSGRTRICCLGQGVGAGCGVGHTLLYWPLGCFERQGINC